MNTARKMKWEHHYENSKKGHVSEKKLATQIDDNLEMWGVYSLIFKLICPPSKGVERL